MPPATSSNGSDEYTSAASAVKGGLKLKGSSRPIGVVKKRSSKTKKSKKDGEVDRGGGASATASTTAERDQDLDDPLSQQQQEQQQGDDNGDDDDRDVGADTKTPAQRRHEEARRKRLLDRLQDPAAAGKTHKQRVEELNRYLSRLSEHHDMPRIGPG